MSVAFLPDRLGAFSEYKAVRIYGEPHRYALLDSDGHRLPMTVDADRPGKGPVYELDGVERTFGSWGEVVAHWPAYVAERRGEEIHS